AAFQPRAAAQAYAHVRAVGDLHSAAVAIEVGENTARHAGQDGDRRIVRMNADTHAGLFGHRRHLLNEKRVVLPDFLLGELAAMGKRSFEGHAVPDALLVGAVEVELAGGGAADSGAAAAPDAVAHVGVGGVVDAGLAEIAKVLLVLFDLLIAAGKVQGDLRHVVDAGIADVPDRDAGFGVALLDLHEA